MRFRAALIATALAGTLLTGPADAIIIERVVAVIGEKAILQSDVRTRARPFLVQLYQKVPPGPQRAAAESKVYSQLIERMVDEELEAAAAARSNTTVTSDEIDHAIRNVARMARMTVAQLYGDVRNSSGMTEQEYRQEIRRQVLEGKLLNNMVRERVTDPEIEAMFNTILAQDLRLRLYKPSWIVLKVGDDPPPEVVAARTDQAKDIVKRARAGSDFGSLAAQFSDDPTASKAGKLGIRAPAGSPLEVEGKHEKLAATLERVAMSLKPGELSDPFRWKDAIVVLRVDERQPSRYTVLENHEPEMMQRVRAAKLEKAKKKWLRDLRGRTYVDIRY